MMPSVMHQVPYLFREYLVEMCLAVKVLEQKGHCHGDEKRSAMVRPLGNSTSTLALFAWRRIGNWSMWDASEARSPLLESYKG